MFQVARKFRVLQVGGHDLGSLFNQKRIILMLVCLILKVAIKML